MKARVTLTSVSEGSVLTKLAIGGNNLSEVDPGLMARATKKLCVSLVMGQDVLSDKKPFFGPRNSDGNTHIDLLWG